MSPKRIKITGTALPLRGNDIDTDQIVPARFLKEITFEKMGDYLFYDIRFDKNDQKKTDTPLNEVSYQNATIMVVQKNFGCGSSREHAPQAILRAGFKAIIGESFAEIFAGNCKAIGIPTVTAAEADIATLLSAIEAAPDQQITLDIDSKTVQFNGKSFSMSISDDKRQSFLEGTWDVIATLKANESKIKKTAKSLPYLTNFE